MRQRKVTLIAIAAAVLVGAGVYGVTQLGGDDEAPAASTKVPNQSNQPTEVSDAAPTPPPYPDDAEATGLGTYRSVVGLDTTSGATIEADLTFADAGWSFAGQPVIFAGDDDDTSPAAGVGIVQVGTLPAESGCSTGETANAASRRAATEPAALARQLTKLPHSSVVQAPASTVAFDHDAVHVRMRIDAECPYPAAYVAAEGDLDSLGVTYSPPWKVVADFLVVDVDGTTIVAALWHDSRAPSDLVDKATRVRDSIRFVPREPTG